MSKKELVISNIQPLNERQKALLKSNKDLVVYGSAGTGKTFLSLYKGLRTVLSSGNNISKVVIIRSAVPTRGMGFLPGSLEDKIKVYEEPYEQICEKLYDDNAAYRKLKNRYKIIEFMTSSYVRGITLEDCYVIVDEFQNMSFHELDSIFTRLGRNCIINFCGDAKQTDLSKPELHKFMKILAKLDYFETIEFSIDDVVRGDKVKAYLKAKEEVEYEGNTSEQDLPRSRPRANGRDTKETNARYTPLQTGFAT